MQNRLLSAKATLPDYDRAALAARMVHLGFGAFHRAHQGVYTDILAAEQHSDWGYYEVNLIGGEQQIADLKQQDNLYTVAEMSAEAWTARVVGVVKAALHVQVDGLERVLAAMCEPQIAIVSLTITEKGYCHSPATGQLLLEHPMIAADLQNPHQPLTAPGIIVEALARRKAAGLPAFTVMSCDNMPENGHVTRQVVTAYAREVDAELAIWIEQNVTFPSTMVDRIVPAVTPETLEKIIQLAREIGSAKPAYICQGWGPQRHSNGEQTARAIAMLSVLTGNVGINGGNSGVREGTWDLGVEWFSMLENPVKTQISVFTWTDAIDHGAEMTATRDGVRGKDKLDVPIKFLWCYASNTLINQHGDIAHTHEVLQDDSKCEMIVGIEHFMTASAKYCDILLPDLMPTEQEDLISHESAGNMGYVILGQPATSPKFERKPIYWMLSEVAKRLGPDVYQTFTEGRTQHEWVKYLHAKTKARNPEMPDYEEMKQTGIFKKKCPEEHYVAFRSFREDPAANPLKTPSGKIEIYSERLATLANTWELKKDEIIHPLPAYTPGFDGWDDPLRQRYPLQLTGFHYKARTHSSYGNIDVLQQACPQEIWINPIDAQARGIQHGDTVRVFNQNGEMLIPAKVTPRILPGVTAIGQGAWLNADMFGDKVDRGGSINILTSHRPSPLAKGNPSHSNLVQVEKA